MVKGRTDNIEEYAAAFELTKKPFIKKGWMFDGRFCARN